MTAKPIPEALYPCHVCCEDYSWPAEDLWWSESQKAWECDNCWSCRDGEDYDEPKGISLADEIKAQQRLPTAADAGDRRELSA